MRRVSVVVTIVLWFFTIAASAAPEYQVVDIGEFTPVALNDSNEIVGFTDFDKDIAVLVNKKGIQELGEWIPTCMNNSGKIGGYVRANEGLPRACLWEKSRLRLIDLPNSTSHHSSVVFSVNERGESVGIYSDSINRYRIDRVFYENKGTLEYLADIDRFYFNSYDMKPAINNSGRVLIPDYPVSKTLWKDSSSPTILEWISYYLPRSGGCSINENGITAGYLDARSWSSTIIKAATWDVDGNVTVIHPEDYDVSTALDINNSNEAVGWAFQYHNNKGGAALWKDGTFYDLDELTGIDGLIEAIDINNRGVILCLRVTKPYWSINYPTATLLIPKE